MVTRGYFGDDPDAPPFVKALAEVRRLATQEGWCYQHVQAISVAIDMYAEKAFGNREYFLNNRMGLAVGSKTFRSASDGYLLVQVAA